MPRNWVCKTPSESIITATQNKTQNLLIRSYLNLLKLIIFTILLINIYFIKHPKVKLFSIKISFIYIYRTIKLAFNIAFKTVMESIFRKERKVKINPNKLFLSPVLTS
jgi:hypothetical protein